MTAPHPHTPSPATIIGAAIEAMAGTLTVARALIAAGRRVDLGGLDREVATICAAAMVLPEAEGRALRPLLVALERDIGVLQAALATADAAP